MPTNLYGQGDNYHPTNSHVLPALIRRFHEAAERGDASVTCGGTGTPLREFLHVDDLGEACVFALEQWQPGPDEHQFLNVGTGVDLRIRELAEAMAAATGFEGEIHWDASKPDGTLKKQLDVSWLAALGGRRAPRWRRDCGARWHSSVISSASSWCASDLDCHSAMKNRIHRRGIGLATTGATRLMPARFRRSWAGRRR